MDGQTMRKLRHDLRGCWHALSLCLCALDLSEDPKEKVEMLDLLTQSAEEIDGVLLQMQELGEMSGNSAAV
jgi:hypothetical protein